MRERVVFEVPFDARVGSCMGCGKGIVWIVTKAGKRMPVESEDRLYGEREAKRGESHFGYCPAANTFRRSRS